MEYHSFLYGNNCRWLEQLSIQSFRLLMEYHSFLFYFWNYDRSIGFKWFPSPYGVSFILICIVNAMNEKGYTYCFRLLMEYHSFL